MKRNFFTSVLLLLGLFFSIGLVSCGEGAPDLSKKERDPRLIGAWSLENKDASFSPKTKHIEFKADGSCVGFSYPGGKRLFYTKENHQLYLFVYGEGLKLSNRTYEEYYLIERDTLYLWLSKDEMLARQYKHALAYTRTSKP
ncbi:hypothetical protein HMPREF1556_01484 [Porphyromonas sp. oral taxon 278 str. W7784]|uniref:hypothetical protein n=1 Tax=Porphyromonas sp. oral taxon 278 TaxID=712437 RepID=UPI0003AD47BD|nr:hypothetical protein [Porphyromonas sp. oral taxon 278]ERJ71091.1 hypothetical protein HMPREF1556_01484 [Porphyromonas sp. oral taxon 278 str. W7784]